MAKETKVETGKTVHILLSDIHADSTWNARSGKWQDTKAGGPDDEDTGFAGLVESIRARGLDDAIVLRPMSCVQNKAHQSKQKYALVAGFRRFAAVSLLAKEAKSKNPDVKAEIRELNDLEARSLNIRENTARDNLSAQDLAWAIHDMITAGATTKGICSEMNKSQPYVDKLARIMSDIDAKVLAKWRNGAISIPVANMYNLAVNCPRERQSEEFEKLVQGRSLAGAGKGKGGGKGKGKLVKNLMTRAHDLGQLLGSLEREEHISLLKGFNKGNINRLLVVPDKMTDAQRDKLVAAYKEGYKLGGQEPETEEPSEAPAGE
jgi:ParB/RepB/Spo0J family partition protein